MSTDAKSKAGLEDVVAASSSICYLDGDRGVLAYYGYDIHDLARGASFEEVCYLLWHGRLPSRAELGDLQSQLAAERPLSEAILRLMKQVPANDGMDVLRTVTSALARLAGMFQTGTCCDCRLVLPRPPPGPFGIVTVCCV